MRIGVLNVRPGHVLVGHGGERSVAIDREIDLGIGGAGGPRLWLRVRDAVSGAESLVEYHPAAEVEVEPPVA